jgi:hypothetical protein
VHWHALRTAGSHHEVVLRSTGNRPERYIRYRRPVYPSALYLDGLLPCFVFEFDEYDVECVNLNGTVGSCAQLCTIVTAILSTTLLTTL